MPKSVHHFKCVCSLVSLYNHFSYFTKWPLTWFSKNMRRMINVFRARHVKAGMFLFVSLLAEGFMLSRHMETLLSKTDLRKIVSLWLTRKTSVMTEWGTGIKTSNLKMGIPKIEHHKFCHFTVPIGNNSQSLVLVQIHCLNIRSMRTCSFLNLLMSLFEKN